MVYEFAVDPELVAGWGERYQFRYFIDKFGLGQPRIVSGYPKLVKWRSQVLKKAEGSGASAMEMQRLTALLLAMTEAMIARPKGDYDGNKKWSENTKDVHEKHPFHAILAKDIATDDAWLNTEDLGEKEFPRWDIGRSAVVPREEKQMAVALSGLLANSARIVIVDPHFDPLTSRHQKTFRELFRSILKHRHAEHPEAVDVMTGTGSDRVGFRNDCLKLMPRNIPTGLVVNFKRLIPRAGGEALHNRYILTNLGGVLVGYGLDKGKSGQTDDLVLLDRNEYLDRWNKYAGMSGSFDVDGDPVMVEGCMPL